VTYDRDEWRQPWRDEPLRSPAEPSEAAEPRGATVWGARPTVDERTNWTDDRPGIDAPEPGAAATDEPSRPIARFPQPPPSSWDDRSHGPGSPAGSVRPPDTTGTVEAPDDPSRRRGGLGIAVGAFAGAVLGTLATLALTGTFTTSTEPEAPPPEEATEEPGEVFAPTIELPEGNNGSSVPAVAEAVTPSVVRIDVSTGTVEPLQQTPALGSGVIFRSDGYILTNHHVVDGGEAIQVRLASGEVLEAEVIGTDELNDLAVVRVDQNGLPAIQQRPADEPIIVGEQVVAIGSPFGLDASVTTGIVSALNREIHLDEPDEEGNRQTITAVIQTDAAINPGNSGGALVDSQGRLIGINTAILTRTGASQGVGFAVSAEQAVSSGDQLIEHGFVRHPLLGIAGYDVNPDVAEEFELPSSQGAIIESVQEGTGADDAGLRSGDIIVEVDGEQLATMAQLVAEVRRRAPGETIELVILRDGETITFDIELGERPR
jgi:S1-C subfamily serine protease